MELLGSMSSLLIPILLVCSVIGAGLAAMDVRSKRKIGSVLLGIACLLGGGTALFLFSFPYAREFFGIPLAIGVVGLCVGYRLVFLVAPARP
jgi:hypothetical protein